MLAALIVICSHRFPLYFYNARGISFLINPASTFEELNYLTQGTIPMTIWNPVDKSLKNYVIQRFIIITNNNNIVIRGIKPTYHLNFFISYLFFNPSSITSPLMTITRIYSGIFDMILSSASKFLRKCELFVLKSILKICTVLMYELSKWQASNVFGIEYVPFLQ